VAKIRNTKVKTVN